MSDRFSPSFVSDMRAACQNIADKFELFLVSIEGDLHLLSYADDSVELAKAGFREAIQENAHNGFSVTNEELDQQYGEDFPYILQMAAKRAIPRAA